MTYVTDIAARTHDVGYYVAFEGIATRLSTHDLTGLVAGTFLPVLLAPPRGSANRLDRERGLILPGGFSVQAADNSSLRTLIARRGGTEDKLSLSLSKTATAITLSKGNYATGTTIYVDRETITLGTKSGNVYNFSARGVQSSQARPHGAGTVVSDRPRYWLGRRAQMFAVNLATGTTQAIRTGILSQSPRFVNGSWSLEFIDLQRELNRRIFHGWSPQKVVARGGQDYPTLAFLLDVGDARHFADGDNAYVRVQQEEGIQVYSLESGHVDRTNNHLTLELDNLVHATESDRTLDVRPGADVQQVCLFTADPAHAALMMMLSDLGDASNHATYDVLPGVSPALTSSTGDIVGKRVGAALPSSWVDVTAWEALEGAAFGPATFYLDDPMSLLEFLVREVAWRLGGYVYVNDSGQISFRRYLPALPAAALPAITTSDLRVPNVSTVDDESEVLGSAVMKCNWDPELRQHMLRVETSWLDTFPLYGEGRPSLELESRSLWVGQASPSPLVSAPGSSLQIVAALDRLYSRSRNGVRRHSMALLWNKHLDALPGWTFAFTDGRVPNLEGSLGVTARQLECVAVHPDYATGQIALEAEEKPQGWLVAPVGIITLVSAQDLFDLESSADYYDGNPASDFPVGATVRIYGASASPPFSASGTAVILSVQDPGQIELTATFGGGFTLAAGDLVCLESSANTGNENTTGADVQDHLFMVDADDLIDAGTGSERDGTRWA